MITKASARVRLLRVRSAVPTRDHHAAAHALLGQVIATADIATLGVSAHVGSMRLRASEREIADGTAAASLARQLRVAVERRS
jgi:hypothetical protein